MKKKKMRLKGKLRLYMNWPLIMTFLLVAMNIWVLMVDRKAAFIMFMFILIYLAIAGGLYFYNRSLILADLIQFSTQYKGIERIINITRERRENLLTGAKNWNGNGKL